MRKLTLSDEEVKKIAKHYIHNYDKFYRMCAGVSTELVRYRDGIIYIEISNEQRSILSTHNTAICFAREYRDHIAELKAAKGFVVIFFDRENTPGCYVMGDHPIEGFKALLKGMRRPENRKLHSIYAGLFNEEMNTIEKDLVRNN